MSVGGVYKGRMVLREAAYRVFTRQLVAREIAPGAFVSQRELAARTGFPLGAIREMIPRLEAEGLLATLPQRGLKVMAPDVRLVREAFEVRALIEKAALATYAAAQSEAAIAAERDLLLGVDTEMRSGITAPLLARAQGIDWGFHDRLVAALDNRLLAETHRVNSIRIRVMLPDRVTLSPPLLAATIAAHLAIIDALVRHDTQAALAALERHLGQARRRALEGDAAVS